VNPVTPNTITPKIPASIPTPIAPLSTTATPTPTPSVQQPVDPSTHVQIALTAIAASLPEALSHKVPARPDQFVAVPIAKVAPQLAQGQIVLTAAELRECAPDYFAALTGHEDQQIALPLGDIVKQLAPEHFVRRPQQRVQVPSEVAPVFAAGGGAAAAKMAAPVSAMQSHAPAYRAQPTPTVTTTTTPTVAPTPAPAGKISMSPQALAALSAATAPAAPGTPIAHAATPAPAMAPMPAIPATPAPRTSIPSTSAHLPKKSSITTPKPTGNLAIPLSSVCHEWVSEVRSQLTDVDVEQSKILAPLELLEPAMKSGKVIFSWEEVAVWIQPPLMSPPTKKVGEMPVDLPLKVIAPLFMAHHRAATQKRVAVDENIPDLFAGGSAGAEPAAIPQTPRVPATPVAATPIPAAPIPMPTAPARSITPVPSVAPSLPTAPSLAPLPTVQSTPAPSAPAPAHEQVSLESVIGNGTGHFGAKEIVANAARLPGVSGALLAMNDGLLVTNVTAPNIKAETIAAFLPQMFGRMNQYTKELALGALQHLSLGVPDGQWHVIKCETIYFAVLGKPGEPLPLNLLTQVAAELSNQSK
jgi:predicted regulator of Ras-like GTPase activity (Roadblock/LC7/MglB family)